MAGGGQEGNDTFWPGYVDAISNLVLNLLFVVAILTIAVFLFAIELGRKQASKASGGIRPSTPVTDTAKKEKAQLEDEVAKLRKQVADLKAAQSAAPAAAETRRKPVEKAVDTAPTEAPAAGGDSQVAPKHVDATNVIAPPEKEIEKLQFKGAAVVVDFQSDAVTLTGNEMAEAKKVLAGVVASGGARLEVLVPGSFSETRRLAFYRAMAVRNLLIEMGVPVQKIEVSVKEVKSGGDSTKVLVRGLK